MEKQEEKHPTVSHEIAFAYAKGFLHVICAVQKSPAATDQWEGFRDCP